MAFTSRSRSVGFALLCTLSGLAVAQAPGVPPKPAGFDKPVNSATLASQRGGNLLVRNDMELSGVTAGNSARNVETGSNSIGSGAFANMNGLPVVIQNSGANVLIQNATILNVKMN